MRKHKVMLSHPFTSNKCAFAERAIYTWSRLVYKYLTLHNTSRYIDKMERLVESYNKRSHSSLPEDLSPAEAELAKMQPILEKHHRSKMDGEDAFVKRRKTKPLLLGTKVRISIQPQAFQGKPYFANWSSALYTVVNVISHRPRFV